MSHFDALSAAKYPLKTDSTQSNPSQSNVKGAIQPTQSQQETPAGANQVSLEPEPDQLTPSLPSGLAQPALDGWADFGEPGKITNQSDPLPVNLSDDDKIAMLENPHTSNEQLLALAADPNTRIAKSAGSRLLEQNLSEALKQKLAASCNSSSVLIKLLSGPLEASSEIKLALAQNPHTSLKLLDELAQNASANVKEEVNKHPKIQERGRIQLAEHSTSSADLARLGDDPSEKVRRAVANNPTSSAETLLKLLQSKDAQIQASVLQHPHVTPTILEQLAHSPEEETQLAVANHPSASLTALEQLAHSPSETVQCAVLSHPNFPAEKAIELLEKLASSKEKLTRAVIASDPRTSTAALQKVAEGPPLKKVQLALAGRSNTPPEVLGQLALSYDYKVAAMALSNPKTPTSAIQEAFSRLQVASQSARQMNGPFNGGEALAAATAALAQRKTP